MNNTINRRKVNLIIIILSLVSILFIIGSLAVGYYKITLTEIISFLFQGKDSVKEEIVIIIQRIRLPRIIAAFFIGAGLSIAGASFQGMFKNPLVSPDILGVVSGAGFGAALAISLKLNNFYIQLLAFLFGIIFVTLAYFIGTRTKYNQEISLILAGTMLGTLATSLTTLLKYVASPNDTLPNITYWLMGSLSRVNNNSLLFSIIPIIIGTVILYLLRWQLNILTLGDEEALALGIEPKKVRLIAIFASTIISAASVCLGGIIGWVGLMIPHIARSIIGADYRYLLPVSFLLGGSYLLVMDDLARSLLTIEIPLGVLTSVLGAPFFIVLILGREK
ncbi:MAG TPA: iron ABC transporter permease [Haloplasmataceae bacterium]